MPQDEDLKILGSVTPSEQKSLEMMCDAIVNKLLHTPLTQLKKSREEPDGDQLVTSVRKLFALDDQPSEPVRGPLPIATATLVSSKTRGERS